MAFDSQDDWSVEGMLLSDLDDHAGSHTELVEERHHRGIGRPGHRDLGEIAGLEVVQRRHGRDVVFLRLRNREAVRARGRAVERHEDPLLDLVRELVLEARRQAVGFVPGVAEHVGEEPLDDAMAPDGGDGSLAARRGEAHAVIGPMIDETPLGQAFHRRGDRARADAQGVGQVAGVGLALLGRGHVRTRRPGVAVDRLQCLALGFRQV